MAITVDYVGEYEPSKGSREACGSDLRAWIPSGEVVIRPGCFEVIRTGIKAQPPIGYAGFLMIRSGQSKRGLRLTTGVSLIDPDYTGDITCNLYNDSDYPQVVRDGERIAQIVYVRVPDVRWNRVEELKVSERGDGGFGSSGRM